MISKSESKLSIYYDRNPASLRSNKGNEEDKKKRKKNSTWRNGDLNPGPFVVYVFACKTNVMPLHHFPNGTTE